MPIADGYEAIQRITTLFESNKNHLVFNEEESKSSSTFMILSPELKGALPFIIACSGLINPDVVEKTKTYGFNSLYEVPLNI